MGWPIPIARGGATKLTITADDCQAADAGSTVTVEVALPSHARYVGLVFGEDHTPFEAPGDVSITGIASLADLPTAEVELTSEDVLVELETPLIVGELVGGETLSIELTIADLTPPVVSRGDTTLGNLYGAEGDLDGTSFTFQWIGEDPIVVYANGSLMGSAPADEAEFLVNLNAQLAPFVVVTTDLFLSAFVFTGQQAGPDESFTLTDTGALLTALEFADGTFTGDSNPGDITSVTDGAVSVVVVHL